MKTKWLTRAPLSRVRRKLSRIQELFRAAGRARRNSGKSLASQVWEIARLRLAEAKLSAREYYDFQLYDDRRFSYESKRQFIGTKRAIRLYTKLNHRDWIRVADDKLVFHSVMATLGLPLPKLYAIYHSEGRFFGAVTCLKDERSLAHFLRHEMPYPFFCKPVRGSHGVGGVAVVSVDRDRDELTLANEEKIELSRYIGWLTNNVTPRVRRYGYVFQEHLKPHPDMLRVGGNRLSSVRIIVLLCKDGPRVIRAVWKIPVGRNMSDNFRHGSSGNLLGHINLETGTAERVIGGVGVDQSEIGRHPDTNTALLGVTLPHWSRLLSLCSKGASAFPELRWQNWDIAMCPEGPVILELNANANLDLAQHAAGVGLYDTSLRTYLTGLNS